MSEETNIPGAGVETQNPYDDTNFVVRTVLGNKRGVIVEAECRRHNYRGTRTDEVTGVFLKVVYTKETGEIGVTTPIISCGDLWPSEDRKTRAIAGKWSVGVIEARSNIAKFLRHLKASGFPMATMGVKGFEALEGADITWKTQQEKAGAKGETKAYDWPGTYHGQVSAEKLAELRKSIERGEDGAAPETEKAPVAAAPEAVDEGALKTKLAEAVAALVKETGEVKRAQLSIKVGSRLQGLTQGERGKALILLMRDDFLASIPGVLYDKATLKAAQ